MNSEFHFSGQCPFSGLQGAYFDSLIPLLKNTGGRATTDREFVAYPLGGAALQLINRLHCAEGC